MMGRLVLVLVLASLLGGGLGDGRAGAQDEGRSGWEGFPLDPRATGQPDAAAPSARQEGGRRADPRADGGRSVGLPVLLVGAGLAAGVALAAIALRRMGAPAPMRLTPTRSEPDALDSCEVVLARWRNRAWFCALRPGSDRPVVASPEFPLRRRDPLTLTPAAIAALEALTVGLERLGWRFAGQGPAWFMRRFVGPGQRDGTPEAPAGRSRQA